MPKDQAPSLVGRRGVLAAAGVLATPAVLRAQGQTGVALVIGNAKYKWEDSLPNVRRDAADIARRFRAMGLKTEHFEDLGHAAMRKRLQKFGDMASGANLAALYFAGHGVTWEKSTFLVPVDADLADPSNVRALSSVNSLTQSLKGAAHKLLALDCCRNNPADGWRQRTTEELSVRSVSDMGPESTNALLRANPNLLRLYSTAPGRIALDGPAEENSPFAAAIMRQLDRETVDLQSLAGKVRRDLLMATQGRQFLWDQNAYDRPFVLGGARSAGTGAGPRLDPSVLVEFDKAYAYARQNEIPLPDGVVGIRASNNLHSRQKIGSYTFDSNTDGGRHVDILLIVSVEENGSTSAIVATNAHKSRHWRLVNGVISGDRLEIQPRSASPHFTFDWRDVNTGSLSLIWEGTTNGKPFVGHFTRLDG